MERGGAGKVTLVLAICLGGGTASGAVLMGAWEVGRGILGKGMEAKE